MTYFVTWTNVNTGKVLKVDEFDNEDDALADCSVFWGGNAPMLITVTDADGTVIAQRGAG
jgi:hypothetical protein